MLSMKAGTEETGARGSPQFLRFRAAVPKLSAELFCRQSLSRKKIKAETWRGQFCTTEAQREGRTLSHWSCFWPLHLPQDKELQAL